jgi:nucleoside-diphosphate-sugar epimerase
VGRVLVTGGTGFLGAHLAGALEGAGYEVRVLDLHPPEPGAPAGREYVRADTRDRDAMSRAVSRCEVVVDNAALVPVSRATPEAYRSVNLEGCRATLDAAEAEGAYVLHVSSSAIYGVPVELPVTPETPLAPFEPYGSSKAEAERLVHARREAGVAVASLRPRTLLGEGRLGLFDVIFARVRRGRRVPMFGRGLNRVQMCDVDDFCGAALAAIERRASGDYNVGSAAYGTVRTDLEQLIDRVGSRSRLQPVPVWAIRAVLQPLDALGRSPFNEWHWRSAPESFYFDISRAREELGWEPRRSNVDALENAYRHYVRRASETGQSAHRTPLAGALARILRG